MYVNEGVGDTCPEHVNEFKADMEYDNFMDQQLDSLLESVDHQYDLLIDRYAD